MENRRGLRTVLLAGLASSALAAPAPAFAQDEPRSGTAVSEGDEVVVTARRRDERELDVPISMTVDSGEELDIRGAADITALQRTTPNLTMQVSRGTNSTLTAFIRGIGQQDPLWGFEPGVGLYVDDVYIARPQGAVLDIYDVERIEVLRGPQGTLYGRNTIGGAVKYVTRRLNPLDPEFRARAEIGSYNEANLVLSGSMPLSDQFRIGAALARYSRDGFGDNLTLGVEHANRDVIAGRFSAELEPTPDLFFRLSIDHLEDTSNGNNGHRATPGFPIPTPPLDDVYDTLSGIGYVNDVITSGASLTAEWRASDVITLRSISAYREGRTRGDGIDFDGLPEPFFDIPGFYDDHQFSQELQAQLDFGRVNGVLGAYFMDGMAAGAFYAVLGNAGITQPTSGEVNTSSIALFGDFSIEVTGRLDVSIGARWTEEEREAEVFKANFLGLGVPAPGAAPFQILTDYTNARTFSEVTPRVSATYEITDDFNIYAAYGEGFKSGGFDMRGDASVTPATMNGYDPEIVDSVELGFKADLFDDRLRLTGAVFHAAYEGQQVTTQVPVGASAVSFVDNVGSSTIEGAELEGQARITDWLSANFAIGYVDAAFDEYISFVPGAPGNGFACAPNPPSPPSAIGCYADVSEFRVFQNTPELSGFIGLTSTHDLGSAGMLTLTGNMSFRSDVHLFETPIPALDQEGYELFDASAVWTSADNHWRIGLHGRNLGDERYKTGGYNFPVPLFANSVINFYAPPRTWRLSAQYRY